jgi:hypothetical protein
LGRERKREREIEREREISSHELLKFVLLNPYPVCWSYEKKKKKKKMMKMMMKKILADLIGSSCKDKICTKSSCSSFLHSSQKWILLQKTKEVQQQQ